MDWIYKWILEPYIMNCVYFLHCIHSRLNTQIVLYEKIIFWIIDIKYMDNEKKGKIDEYKSENS